MEAQKPISPLRQRMIDDMRMRKLGDKTQTGYLRAVRQVCQVSWALARYGDGRGSAQLSVAPGRPRHLAGLAQRGHQRAQVLLQRHARPPEADGQDAAGASAAQAAGRVEPREEVPG
jgi:hypothetical protein